MKLKNPPWIVETIRIWSQYFILAACVIVAALVVMVSTSLNDFPPIFEPTASSITILDYHLYLPEIIFIPIAVMGLLLALAILGLRAEIEHTHKK